MRTSIIRVDTCSSEPISAYILTACYHLFLQVADLPQTDDSTDFVKGGLHYQSFSDHTLGILQR